MKKSNEKISLETLEHVAKIARINLTSEEKKRFQKDLNEILAAFKELDKADAKCAPSFQPLDIKDVFRDDVAGKCLTQEKALANTKHREKGFFRGPKAV